MHSGLLNTKSRYLLYTQALLVFLGFLWLAVEFLRSVLDSLEKV